MTLPWTRNAVPLPLIPAELLKRHKVHERYDTRLKAAARLLQALWLSDHKIPTGMHRGRTRARKLGSRLTPAAALAGRNFLSPDLAELAHHVVTYQEPGAFIERNRVFGNALGSTALCLNALGNLTLSPDLAACVLRCLLPQLDIETVNSIQYEHSPGRNDPNFTGDRSAFDAVIWITRRVPGEPLPRRCALAIEFKYTEGLYDSSPCQPGRYDDLAEASGLFRYPLHAALRVNPLQQLFREHLLAQSAVMNDHWPEAVFISIAPAANERARRQAELYASFLNPPLTGQVPFVYLTLDAFVAALEAAGAPVAAEALYRRYLDWGRIDALVADALRKRVDKWSLPRLSTAPKLISKIV